MMDRNMPQGDDDPLATLHKHYMRKLRNPTHNDELALWQDLVRGAQAQQIDPMQQWMQVAGDRPSLDDLLGQPQSIAAVIQSLDGLGANDLMGPVSHDSVLHLFAPEHLRAPEQESLESLVRHSLPGLTLREHHRLALDSAMPHLPEAP